MLKVAMVKLTEEQLAKLYPKVKTYDEVQADIEEMQEKRRPKLVALKVSAQSSLAVIIGATAYALTDWLIKTTIPAVGSAMNIPTVMIGVFGACLIGVTTIANLYYLYRRTSSLIYLTFAKHTQPTILVSGIFVATTVWILLMVGGGFDLLLMLGALTAVNFALAYFVMALSPKE